MSRKGKVHVRMPDLKHLPRLCIVTGQPAETTGRFVLRRQLNAFRYRQYRIHLPMTKKAKFWHWTLPLLTVPTAIAIWVGLFFVGKHSAEPDGAFSPYGRHLMMGAGAIFVVSLLIATYINDRLRFVDRRTTDLVIRRVHPDFVAAWERRLAQPVPARPPMRQLPAVPGPRAGAIGYRPFGGNGPAPAPARYGPPAEPAPGWRCDPAGRFDHRYWDGRGWTDHVATDVVDSDDAPPVVAVDPI